MLFLLIWILCGIACALIANTKNRNVGGWFFIGVLTGFIGLILIAVLDELPESNQRGIDKPVQVQQEKKCPQCAEMVKVEAKICRFCQYKFE